MHTDGRQPTGTLAALSWLWSTLACMQHLPPCQPESAYLSCLHGEVAQSPLLLDRRQLATLPQDVILILGQFCTTRYLERHRDNSSVNLNGAPPTDDRLPKILTARTATAYLKTSTTSAPGLKPSIKPLVLMKPHVSRSHSMPATAQRRNL